MVYSEFLNNIARCIPFTANPVIAIAVSGGCDSISLLLMAHRWSKDVDIKIVSLHIDHNLRQESSEDAEFVKKTAYDLGIDHHTLKWKKTEHINSNIQAQARNARYSLLCQWCNDNNVCDLMIAHHMNDQAETFMLRLERGSGIKGLSCMSVVSYMHNIRILRPLLTLKKKELREYIKEQNHEWLEDPTNDNFKYSRNYIRKFLYGGIPNSQISGELLSERLYVTAQHMMTAQKILDQVYIQHLVKYVFIYPQGFAVINTDILQNSEISRRSISDTIQIIGTNKYPPRSNSIQSLLEHLYQGRSSIITLGHCNIKMSDNKIYLWKEPRFIGTDIVITQQQHLWDKKFIIEILNQQLMNGEYYITNAGNISTHERFDLFSQYKYIPRFIYTSLPVIIHNNSKQIIQDNLPNNLFKYFMQYRSLI